MLRALLHRSRVIISVAAFLSAGGAILFGYTINLLTGVVSSGSRLRDIFPQLFICVIVILVCNLILHRILAIFGATVIAEIRRELTEGFAYLRYEALGGKSAITAMAISHDTARIAPLALLAPQILYNSLICLTCFGYLFYISSVLSLIALTIALVMGLVMTKFNKIVVKQFESLHISEERMSEHIAALSLAKKQMNLNTMRTHHFLTKHVLPTINSSRDEMVKLHYRWGVFSAVLPVFVLMLMAGGIWVASMLNLSSKQILETLLVGSFVLGPLNFLINSGQQIGGGLASIRHLETLGLGVSSISSKPLVSSTETSESSSWLVLEAKDLIYTYSRAGSELFTIGPVSASFKNGSVTFICGGNGSGKSTFLLMLCGLLSPESGYVTVDGGISLDCIRPRMFSAVFSEFHLFDDLVKEGPEIDKNIRSMIELFSLGDKISWLEGQFTNTELSTGQKKRLALIQSLAENRDVLLLDEWAADQDMHFREFFYRKLVPRWRSEGKTIIAITHDDRYFDVCDVLLRFDGGRIIERKTLETGP